MEIYESDPNNYCEIVHEWFSTEVAEQKRMDERRNLQTLMSLNITGITRQYKQKSICYNDALYKYCFFKFRQSKNLLMLTLIYTTLLSILIARSHYLQ